MKFVRFKEGSRRKDSEEQIHWGLVKEDDVIVLKGTPFGDWEDTPKILKVYDVIDFTINREKIREDRMKA